jgi:molybdenum cofactor cytidylyltransferase
MVARLLSISTLKSPNTTRQRTVSSSVAEGLAHRSNVQGVVNEQAGPPVVGIVLAAGASERMGRPKQLLPLAGTTLIDVVVQRVLASRLERVIVVTGSSHTAVAAALAPRHVEIAQNPSYVDGNLSSLRIGAAEVGHAAAVVLLLGDMPGVAPDTINEMMDTWDRLKPWAAVASYSDGEGHPLLLSRAALDHSLTLEGPKALWRMLRLAPHGEVTHVEFDAAMPLDVDTPENYADLLASWPRVEARPGTR